MRTRPVLNTRVWRTRPRVSNNDFLTSNNSKSWWSLRSDSSNSRFPDDVTASVDKENSGHRFDTATLFSNSIPLGRTAAAVSSLRANLSIFIIPPGDTNSAYDAVQTCIQNKFIFELFGLFILILSADEKLNGAACRGWEMGAGIFHTETEAGSYWHNTVTQYQPHTMSYTGP